MNQAEGSRQQTEEQLRLQSAALEAAANAIVITDAKGKIIWVNQAFSRTTGYSVAEALGKNPRLLKSGKQSKAFYKEMWDAILSGKVWHHTIINRRKDGSLNHEDLTITPIRNSEGEITHFVGIKQDITEKTRAQEALLASELRYRRLFESSKDGILILDAVTGQIVDVNPYLTELLGYSKEELLGKELWEIGSFKDIVASRDAFDELQQQGFIRYKHMPLETQGGIVKEVEFVSNSYVAGRIRVIQCNIRDISDRKRAEEDLKAANHELQQALGELQKKSHELSSMTQQLWQASKLATMGELAASIAHELNNPLTTVTLSLEALMLQLANDEKKMAIVETVSKESERMAGLIGNLLQFSRRSHAQVSTLNLEEELSGALNLIDYHLRSHNVKVEQVVAADLPTVQADRQQLLQVFLNLLTNACDAMPDGGTLTVALRPDHLGEQPAVMLEFADTGTGIEATNLDMIWEPFFTTKPAGKGTGLGLPICRRTIEEHGGAIAVESTPGTGTRVLIKLPATSGDDNTSHTTSL
jgi:nitrogen fixation negative regulator NifL